MDVCADNLSFTGDGGAKKRSIIVRIEFRQLQDDPEKYNIPQLKVLHDQVHITDILIGIKLGLTVS